LLHRKEEAIMAAMALAYEDIPVRDEGFTVDDLEHLPDDGRRYELVDGVLLVSPARRWEHQDACLTLGMTLHAACPDHLHVFAPTPDVREGRRTSLEPDVCVVRRADLVRGERYLGLPVLAVEVLSPSSLGIDRLLKRDVYARMGIAHYWIADADDPSITVLRLGDNGYTEVTAVAGAGELTVAEPFAVTVHPDRLVLA
jgi:Uma2 family endonuclease